MPDRLPHREPSGSGVSDGDVPSGQPSRRQALTLTSSLTAAAGLALLGGCASASAPAGGRTKRPPRARPGRPGNASPVRSFQSAPGLHPARAVIRTRSADAASGVILLDSHGGPGQQGPMILDQAGELVWFRPLSDHATPALRAFNVRVQSYHGEPVLTWWQGAVVAGHGQGHYVLANSRYQNIRTVSAHNGLYGDLHEFVLTDAGTAIFSCYGTAVADLRPLGGAAGGQYFYCEVQEVDLATGALVFRWRSDQHVPLSASYAPLPSRGSQPWDPFHLNSISVAPDGNLIISARNTWTVYKVSRRTGAILWRLGGKNSDLAIGSGARFAWQHHVTAHQGGILTIFDNEAGDYRVGKQSRGLVLRADEQGATASFVRQFNPPVPILSAALGSVQELPGGHVLVGWGERPYITEYRTDGSIVFDGLLAGRGTVDYRAFKSPWTGRPAGPVSVAVRASGSGALVYVSWNGDTEVRRWRVLTGPATDKLALAATAARSGFETAIRISKASGYLVVAGDDGNGSEIGRSAPRRL